MHKKTSSRKWYSHLLGKKYSIFMHLICEKQYSLGGRGIQREYRFPEEMLRKYLFGEAVFSCGKGDSLSGKGIFLQKTFQNQISLGGRVILQNMCGKEHSQSWPKRILLLTYQMHKNGIFLPARGENIPSRNRYFYALGSWSVFA